MLSVNRRTYEWHVSDPKPWWLRKDMGGAGQQKKQVVAGRCSRSRPRVANITWIFGVGQKYGAGVASTMALVRCQTRQHYHDIRIAAYQLSPSLFTVPKIWIHAKKI